MSSSGIVVSRPVAATPWFIAVACLLFWFSTAPGAGAAVLQRPPQGEFGANDIYRGGKTTPSIRDVVYPPHQHHYQHHVVLPTSSEQPIKQIPPPPPPPSLESLRPTPSLPRRTSSAHQASSSSWSSGAEGVLGQPQFRLLWATEASSAASAPLFLEDVTRAATPASLTPHTT